MFFQQMESKKNIFDNLSKEELIKKCKALLVLAQKAKQAKSGNRRNSVYLF